MGSRFTPNYTVELLPPCEDLAPHDSGRMVQALRGLGFTRQGRTRATLEQETPEWADARDRRQFEDRASQGEECTWLLSPDGRTAAFQGDAFRSDHLSLRSLLPDGTLVETRRVPERQPDFEWRDDEPPTTGDPEVDQRIDTVVDRILAMIEGKSYAGIYPQLPLAGVHCRVLQGTAAEVWTAHQQHLEGKAPVPLADDLVVPLLYRGMHARMVHNDVAITSFRVTSILLAVLTVATPVVVSWLGGLTWQALLGAVVAWFVARWVKSVVEVAAMFRLITPVVRWWPSPRPVPASEIRQAYADTSGSMTS